MRSLDEVEAVAALLERGCTAKEIDRATGVPWRTVQKWRQAGIESVLRRRRELGRCVPGACDRVREVDERAYAYLLGQYLGDGSIATSRRTERLEIFSDLRYPEIIEEVRGAMAVVMPTSKVAIRSRIGCVAISSYSNHWPCLFPQHGVGPKHEREIVLETWQRTIVERHPRLFLRGLVHADGCRVMNRVQRRVAGRMKSYAYSRYHFTNRSDEIRELFVWACGLAGVECRPNNRWNISVARRDSVALMDEFIGPKR